MNKKNGLDDLELDRILGRLTAIHDELLSIALQLVGAYSFRGEIGRVASKLTEPVSRMLDLLSSSSLYSLQRGMRGPGP